MTFQDLPNELIILIFSYLSPEDLACHASEVCLQWLDVAKDHVLWDNATLIYNDSYPLQFKKTILFAPCFARLEINMFKFISKDLIQSILSGCAVVKSFSFYPNHLMSRDDKLLILNHYKMSVEVLNMYLDDSYVSLNGNIDSLFKLLSCMPCLKSVTLRGFIHSECLSLDIFCNGWRSLECLDISGLAVIYPKEEYADLQKPNPWQSFILHMLDYKAESLKKLSLPEGVFHHTIIDEFEVKFASSAIESIKICEMCLFCVRKLNFLTSLHVVGVSAKEAHNLRSDCLSRGVEYTSFYNWIRETNQFSGLQDLTLENINDDERNVTYEILKACQNIKSITLSSVCHTPTQLAAIILQLPPLKSLSIYRTPCLRSKHLDLLLTYQSNLELLNIRYNTLTDGILQYYRDTIQFKMPKLRLICDWGFWNVFGGQPWPSKCTSGSSEIKSVRRESNESSPSVSLDDKMKIRMLLDSVSDYEDDD